MRQVSKIFFIIAIIGSLFAVKTFAEDTASTALTLPQAEELVLENDDSLKIAKLNMEVAKSEFQSVNRLLTVNGDLSYSQIIPNPDPAIPGTKNPSFTKKVQIDTKWNVTGVIALKDMDNVLLVNYLPFNLSRELGAKSSEIGYLAKIQAYETARITAIVQVRTAYCAAFKDATLYKLANENLKLANEHYRQTKVLFEVGKVSKLDVMEAEQQVKAAEVGQSNAELSKTISFYKLGILLGKDTPEEVTLNVDNRPLAETERIDIEASISGALKDAPDIKLALANIELAKINLRMDSVYHLKSLTVGLSETIPEDGKNLATTLSLSISGPLDDQIFKKKAESKMNMEAAALQLKTATTSRQSMILDSFRLWKVAELSMGPAKVAMDIAKERLRIVNLKFDNGIAAVSEVNLTRQALSQAEKTYWETWQNLQQAREGFYQAVWGKPVLKQE